jgi:hypothetical protein
MAPHDSWRRGEFPCSLVAAGFSLLLTKKDSLPIAVRSGPVVSTHPPQPQGATSKRVYRTARIVQPGVLRFPQNKEGISDGTQSNLLGDDEAAIFLWNSLDMSESCNALVASGLSRIETFTIRGMKEHNCTGSCVAIRNVGSGLGWLSGMKRSVPSLLI